MKWFLQRREPEDLENVEGLLQNVFEPVAPRRSYVYDLNRRLSDYPSSPHPILDPSLPQAQGKPLLLTLGWSLVGLVSGITLVIVGIRVVILLISSLRAIYQKQM